MQLKSYTGWSAPAHWHRIVCVDAHTAGEPLRIIFSGFPELPGASIPARRATAQKRHDFLRTALMWEPRGHADMYGCLLTPPVSETAHFGVLFLHNEGYSSMCGHGIIAVTKVVLQLGLLPSTLQEIHIDTPAGLVRAFPSVVDGEVAAVSFLNVPSFAAALNEEVLVPGYGTIRYDLAFGGAFYAVVDVNAVGLGCRTSDLNELISAGQAVKAAVAARREIRHPFEQDLGFLYGTIFTDAPQDPNHHSRNVCIFAEGEVDRSPTGTGVSARLAIHYAKDQLSLQQPVVFESIIGTTFTGSVAETLRFGPYDAVVPRVEGRAFITAQSTFLIDPEDPLGAGFLLR